jgi:MFS family permease
LNVPVALFGVLLAMPAVGALLGSMLSHRISKRLGRTTVMAWSMALSSLLVILQGFSPNYIVLAILVTAGTAIITMWNVLLMATYHQIIPTELFGRIHGTRRTLVWGLMPIGSLLGGLIATIDLRMPFFVGGTFCLVLALIGFRFIVSLKTLIAESE